MSEPDIVDALTDWLDAGPLPTRRALRDVLSVARHEIVALRDERETLWGVAFDYVRIRTEALEEAAQMCDVNPNAEAGDLAAGIRALKDKRHE